jgi:hypothetical protein
VDKVKGALCVDLDMANQGATVVVSWTGKLCEECVEVGVKRQVIWDVFSLHDNDHSSMGLKALLKLSYSWILSGDQFVDQRRVIGN